MRRYRFAPLHVHQGVGCAPGRRHNVSRPGEHFRHGDEVEVCDADALLINAAHEGWGGASCLVPLDDRRDALADSETPGPLALPPLPDGPEAVAPVEADVAPLAAAIEIAPADPPADLVTVIVGIAEGDDHDALAVAAPPESIPDPAPPEVSPPTAPPPAAPSPKSPAARKGRRR